VQGKVQAKMIKCSEDYILRLQRPPDSYVPGGHSPIQSLLCKIGEGGTQLVQ